MIVAQRRARAACTQIADRDRRAAAPTHVKALHTNGEPRRDGGAMFALGYMIALLLYIVITLYGINVMRSVVTEKIVARGRADGRRDQAALDDGRQDPRRRRRRARPDLDLVDRRWARARVSTSSCSACSASRAAAMLPSLGRVRLAVIFVLLRARLLLLLVDVRRGRRDGLVGAGLAAGADAGDDAARHRHGLDDRGRQAIRAATPRRS